MKLGELLEAVPARHRAVVANTIGLPRTASASAIAAHLLDEQHLDELAATLSVPARAAATRKLLGDDRPASSYYYYSSSRPSDGDTELERCGLAFAFRSNWQTDYRIPDDLCEPLVGALAAAHGAQLITSDRVMQWFIGTHQLARDAAALWAALHREPVRVKADGDLYQRALPKLRGVLATLDPGGVDAFDHDRRLHAALAFLREEGCVQLRVDVTSNWETRRELVAKGNLERVLSLDPELLCARLLAHAELDTLERAAVALLGRVGARPVSITTFGAAVRELTNDAIGYPSMCDWSSAEVALRALLVPWLAGRADLGIGLGPRPGDWDGEGDGDGDGDGGLPAGEHGCEFVAVREALPFAPLTDRPLGVCQGNFEIVLLRLVTPVERLRLELTCEQMRGQKHVYAITRQSVLAGQRAGEHAGGALGMLASLAGELPQNVERTVGDWLAHAGPPLRLRTAMMLDAGDRQTADLLAAGPLAGLVIERLGESLLAFTASRIADVQRALGAYGHRLEPGIEQISGTWALEGQVPSQAQSAWQPRGRAKGAHDGKLCSTIRGNSGPGSATHAPGGQRREKPAPRQPMLDFGTIDDLDIDGFDGIDRIGHIDHIGHIDPDDLDAPEDFDPHAQLEEAAGDRGREDLDQARSEDLGTVLDVIVDALAEQADLNIVYAGADGLSARTITPIEILGAQLRAYCHLRRDERRFWLPAIQIAERASQ